MSEPKRSMPEPSRPYMRGYGILEHARCLPKVQQSLLESATQGGRLQVTK